MMLASDSLDFALGQLYVNYRGVYDSYVAANPGDLTYSEVIVEYDYTIGAN